MKKLNLNMILALAGAFLGLVAVLLVFATAMKFEFTYGGFTKTEKFSGLDVVFGCEVEGEKLLNFSFMNMLTFILAIAGVACAVVSALKPELAKVLGLVAAGLFLVAAIFFFCTVAFSRVEGGSDVKKEIADYLKLGVGAIFSGILSLLACACVATPAVMGFVKKN